MPAVARRIFLVLSTSFLAPFLMASSCSEGDEEGSEPAASESIPEVDVLPVESGEPDPGLGVDGIELDGPMAPQEGDGSTPDEPSFEPDESTEPSAAPVDDEVDE